MVRQKTAFVQWSHSGAYVVAGYFGGLGMRMAQWMVDRGASHIVLRGTSGCPASAATVGPLLEQWGAKVACLTMDASKQEDVTVKGIVHTAGVVEDTTLSLQDLVKFERVMKPKGMEPA